MGDYTSFIRKVNEKYEIDLSLYKEAQMKRRLTSLRNKRGYTDFSDYFHAICKDDELLKEFLDRMTINVSEFYRNPKRWDILRDKILPEIINHKKKVTIWSAACSTGDEPYSLSIMFKEHFKDVEVSIIATDIDKNILKKAKQGIYNASALKDMPEHKKSKYFLFKNNNYYIKEQIKSVVTFQKHNLLKDPYPSNIDLIVCRNVLIYFTDPAKKLIYQRFGQSLNENGFLFVGSTEQIFNPQEYQLRLYDTFFYQKDE